MGLTERWLVWRLRRRDEAAARELIERYHRGIYAYLRHLGARPETAEDLTQETYARVWQRIDRLQRPNSLRSWLYTIARNEYLQLARRGGPQHQDLDDADLPPDPGLSALQSVSDAMESSRVRRAVRELDQDLQEVVALHYFRGLSIQEVAAVINAPVGTVKSRVHRALTTLRAQLPEEQDHVSAQSRKAIASRP